MKSKHANSRQYFENINVIPKSKRSQSEVISVILIILLVLVAVIIVWQVVQNIMNNSNSDIANKNKCIASQLSIVKATAGNGTCPYTDKAGAGSCTISMKTVTLRGSPCSDTPPDIVNCNSLVAPLPYPTPTGVGSAPGQVIVSRGDASGNDDTVTARLFVNDLQNPSTGSPLGIYGKTSISVPGLNVSDQVKVAAILNGSGYICAPSDNVKVTAS